MYGYLEVITGPMFAGKTTKFITQFWVYSKLYEKKVLVMKPNIDKRYSETKIYTHDKTDYIDCQNVEPNMQDIDVLKIIEDECDVIMFDEVQFFDSNQILDVISILLANKKSVIVNGLDMWTDGTPCYTTSLLMAKADKVLKMRSTCSKCGKEATKTQRKIQSESENLIEIGGEELYEPRCNECWQGI